MGVTRVEVALRRIAAELDGRGRRWALVGGLAVSARAEPRTTRDVDVAVEVSDDDDAEALVHSLQAAGLQLVAAIEQLATSRLATVRLRPSSDPSPRGAVIDLLLASSGLEPEIVARADRLEIVPGLVVPVARTGDLIAMKVLSRDDRRRPRDAEDLRGLLEHASATEIQLARSSLKVVTTRGFHRGKDLEQELDRALQELGADRDGATANAPD